MVIEEVNALHTQLEIEKSCRENAEVLATKVTISAIKPRVYDGETEQRKFSELCQG